MAKPLLYPSAASDGGAACSGVSQGRKDGSAAQNKRTADEHNDQTLSRELQCWLATGQGAVFKRKNAA